METRKGTAIAWPLNPRRAFPFARSVPPPGVSDANVVFLPRRSVRRKQIVRAQSLTKVVMKIGSLAAAIHPQHPLVTARGLPPFTMLKVCWQL
jgi:hypothetical protein